MPMTNAEAAAKARELWGDRGVVRVRANSGQSTYYVGTVGANPAHVAYGYGATWEEAFAAAELYVHNTANRKSRAY